MMNFVSLQVVQSGLLGAGLWGMVLLSPPPRFLMQELELVKEGKQPQFRFREDSYR